MAMMMKLRRKLIESRVCLPGGGFPRAGGCRSITTMSPAKNQASGTTTLGKVGYAVLLGVGAVVTWRVILLDAEIRTLFKAQEDLSSHVRSIQDGTQYVVQAMNEVGAEVRDCMELIKDRVRSSEEED